MVPMSYSRRRRARRWEWCSTNWLPTPQSTAPFPAKVGASLSGGTSASTVTRPVIWSSNGRRLVAHLLKLPKIMDLGRAQFAISFPTNSVVWSILCSRRQASSAACNSQPTGISTVASFFNKLSHPCARKMPECSIRVIQNDQCWKGDRLRPLHQQQAVFFFCKQKTAYDIEQLTGPRTSCVFCLSGALPTCP